MSGLALTELRAALRIVRDAAVYRLKKREMGNLVTSSTLAVALQLGPRDVAHRVFFGAGLNLFVYLVNDCFDVRVDLEAKGRDQERTRFLADHLRAGWAACAGLAVALAAVAALHPERRDLLVTLAVNVVVIFAYSGALKHRAFADLGAMFAWGVSMAMVGFPLASAKGWRLALVLGALCAVTEGVQVLRDEPTDRASDVRTTAVVLGGARTRALTRVLMALASAYTVLFVDRWVGLAFAVALFVPLRTGQEERGWDTLRALFGLAWLGVLFRVWWRGALDGWLS